MVWQHQDSHLPGKKKITYDCCVLLINTVQIRVFIDNKPYGLYGIQEDFENPWLVNEFNNGEKDYSQGILYNANINANLAFLGNNESLYTRADNAFNDPLYQIKETPSKNDEKVASVFQQLIAFTEFLATAPTTQSNAAAIWNEKIDTDSVLRRYSYSLHYFFNNLVC